ncbi:MAG: hypothetical protein CFE33_10515 [Pseudorhodobacter sp. PARRP1]|nr:MAG: hypothetical protein CFE33_10515 [Pseudorhodobacter sp. PARRP1]
MAGDKFDPDHVVHQCMDAPRWACEIQAFRDKKDYAAADARRIWVEKAGDLVLQTKDYTAVISSHGFDEQLGPSVDEVIRRLLTEVQDVARLEPSKVGVIIILS